MHGLSEPMKLIKVKLEFRIFIIRYFEHKLSNSAPARISNYSTRTPETYILPMYKSSNLIYRYPGLM